MPKAPGSPPATGLAALPGERAAHEFGLHILAPAIQDEPTTAPLRGDRRPQTRPCRPAAGKDCTSLVVSVTNRPGAVHDLLVPLKAHGVSMTRFESRPARTGQWEYYFYIDLEGHPDGLAPPSPNCAPLLVLQSHRRYPVTATEARSMFEQLGLIGCGLMGGSFALGAQARRLVKRVVGYSKSPSTTERASGSARSTRPRRPRCSPCRAPTWC